MRIIGCKEGIEMLDIKDDICSLIVKVAELEKMKNMEMWQLLQTKDDMLKQNSRIRWIIEGNANTRFFH